MTKPLTLLCTFLLLLILFIPLIYDNNGFYGYVVPKALLFQCSVIFGGIAVLVVTKPNKTINYNALSLAITVFLVISTLSNLFSYDSLLSIGATFERMEGAIHTIVLGIFFFLLQALIKDEPQQKNIFLWMLIISSLVAIVGVISGKEVGERLISTIGNPAFLCFYLANHLFLIVLFYLKYQPKYKWLLWVNSFILLWVIIQTLTRTFYIALVTAGFVMAVIYVLNQVKEEKRRKVVWQGLLIFLGVLLILYLISLVPWIRRHYPITRLKDTSSLSARFLVWGIAVKGFGEHWLLGWGQENFNYVYAKFFNPALAADGVWYDRSHNVFLDWFVSGGIVGGLSYIFIWISAVYCIWKSSLQFLLKLVLTGWVVFYCSFIFFNPDSLVNSIFAMFLLGYISRQSATRSLSLPIVFQNFSVVRLLVIGILVTIFYQFTYSNIRSYSVFSRAIAQPTIENLIALSDKAYTIRSAVNLNMVEQLTFMHKTVMNSGLSPEQKQLYTVNLKRLIEKELQRHPPSVKLLELQASVELTENNIVAGEQTLDKILVLSPEYVTAFMQKGKAAFAQNRYDEALLNFDKVIEKASGNVQAKLFRVYANALKNSNYNVAQGLKDIPKKDLDLHIVFVREIFFSARNPQAFVDWLWDGGLYGIFVSKRSIFEWMTAAYQNKDLTSVDRLLLIYRENFACNSPLLARIAKEARNGDPIAQTLEELFRECP
ncbi:O-antigen ligase family protein [Emticicia sp. BO119]|uniref:O-antigen ligase family protein n=1 Tax=Emticicia sp. BO119 TaxID=2757768 RepID=UPI0015F0EF62|nr:O-antigen ligase family protein [Emticicia sp. BO119]MBA4850551.1 O-antigen ligase family protein [Emticicia sp. BO119]